VRLLGGACPAEHQVIDTSRNGGASGDWSADDNSDRRIGLYPTTATNDANVDAYLWVKPPGEADGCRYTAGSFEPDLAYSLAGTAPYPPTSAPTTPSPPPSSPTVPPTTPPTMPQTTSPAPSSTAPVGACLAAYQTTDSWRGGFQGQVTVTAGDAAITGWTVTWTLAGGQSTSQARNGALNVSGSTVTVRDVSWTEALAAPATAQFGFLANGIVTTPALSCTSA
jgi:endoglucanase